MIGLVRIDNEENALLCLKVIRDIMQHQTKVLGNKLQIFLALIEHMFNQIDLMVNDQLDNQAPHSSIPGLSRLGNSQCHENSNRSGLSISTISDIDLDLQQLALPSLKAMASFKVLAECPIIVQSIFDIYQLSDCLDTKLIFNRIKRVLLLQAKPQEQAHASAAAKGTIFTGVSPNIGDRGVFGEFIGSQVNAISSLAYLLRHFEEQLTKLTDFTDFIPNLPDIVIRLLKDCPREKSGVRKELLIATRGIINFNFRIIFLKQVDEFLDERILIGDGLTVCKTLRPLAYSMLADLIYHLRDSLNPSQIRKTVEIYTKNLQNNFPGTSLQTMSAMLLLNMADCVAKMPNKPDAHHYLIMILDAIGNKFAAMNKQYSDAVMLSKLHTQQSVEFSPNNCLVDEQQFLNWGEIDTFTAMPIKTSNPQDRGADPVADNKFLFEKIMEDLKNIFDQLKECYTGSPIDSLIAPAHEENSTCGFTTEEVQVIRKLCHEGANVFQYYETDKPAFKLQKTNSLELITDHYISGTREEKDLLEKFVAVLHCIHPMILHEIFYDQIPIVLDSIPQLPGNLPTLIQPYKQRNNCRHLFEIHASDWLYLLIWSAMLLIWSVSLRIFSILEIANEFFENLFRPFRAILCHGLSRPFQRFSSAVGSGLAVEPLNNIIHDEELCLEKGLLRTQNIPRTHAQYNRLRRPCPKLDFTAKPGIFMEAFVKIVITAVIDIEKKVSRTRNSTFQTALYKNWNYFPREVYSLLLGKIGQQKYGSFLAQILEHPESGPLRKVVIDNIRVLIKSSGDVETEKSILAINSIHIIHSLCKFEGNREWMGENDAIIWLKKSSKKLEADLRENMLPPNIRLAGEQANE
jgi:hypothetical protein